jgi:uncharacterized protein with ParB-like and HNH nuclease domain
MQAGQKALLQFLYGNNQFIIPIYQRTYSWTREQCEQLWDDIVRTGKNEAVKSHFVGSIVYIQHGLYQVGSPTPLLVIDGQQRLTTITLLLTALAQAAKSNSDSLNFSYDLIYDYYLTNRHSKGEEYYKLHLTQGDKNTLIQLIEDPARAKAELSPSRLLENYLFFEDRLRQGVANLNTVYAGIGKLIIVDISLDRDHDNPQLIFESLNSTGMDLSQADLIRNYVLMGLNNEEQTKLYGKYWYPMEQSFIRGTDSYQFDRFMRDYLTIKLGTIPNIDKVYANFKTYQRSQTDLSMQELVADIYRYARYFINMAFEQETDPEIKAALKDINTIKIDVAYPFLLEVYDDYAHQRILRADFIAILRLVESYVFRRAICGVPTNSMNKTFANLAREIDKEHYLESVQAAFLEKDTYRRFPRDEEFRAEFMVKDVYNFRSRNYLLRKLEDFNHPKQLINIEAYTVEHILPQNPQLSREWQSELGPSWKDIQARYLHTIGNLTLTGYNPELSDRPFQEKRDVKPGGFKHTPLRLNEDLAELEHWREREIQQRAAKLANQALRVWSIPYMSPEQISKHSKKVQKPVLAEAIGPIDHPIAGFIPAGFKITQVGTRKFYYFRLINSEWIHYGNGKDPWYAHSWESAGRWLRDFDKKNIMPLGTGGSVHPIDEGKLEEDILTDDSDIEDQEEADVL